MSRMFGRTEQRESFAVIASWYKALQRMSGLAGTDVPVSRMM